jgi:hypothetical protein
VCGVSACTTPAITAGPLLHLQGVPVALISAWLGHADAAFTMKVYVHSQPDVLREVRQYFERGIDEDLRHFGDICLLRRRPERPRIAPKLSRF